MYTPGDIVLVPFPFTDLSGLKVRPAVVVACSKKSADVIVVFITSQMKRIDVAVAVKPDAKNGLKAPSQILCDKIATLDKKVVIGEIGLCSKVTFNAVKGELRKVFNI